MFKDPDDKNEGIVSSIATLDDAKLSLPMTCYYHRLKAVVMLNTKDSNAKTLIGNGLIHPILTEEEDPNFDFI